METLLAFRRVQRALYNPPARPLTLNLILIWNPHHEPSREP